MIIVMKNLRERIADALEAAFDRHRRNNVFRIYVADQRLMPLRSDNVKEIYVLTQNDSLPFACNPNAYHGALLWKSHYKACKEHYLDEIMKVVA